MRRILMVAGLAACGSGPAPAPANSVVVMAPITAPVPPPEVAALNQRVADASLDRAGRCGAVFELFDKFIPPGTTAPAAAAVLTERAWIVVDDPITVLGGEIPIDLNDTDSDVVIPATRRRTPTSRTTSGVTG